MPYNGRLSPASIIGQVREGPFLAHTGARMPLHWEFDIDFSAKGPFELILIQWMFLIEALMV